jgi:hypothetical protein
MPISGIRVSTTPGEDGSTIDDEIAGTNQPSTNGSQDAQHKERLWEWSGGLLSAFALLRRARNTWTAIFAQRQAAGKCESWPSA